MLNFPNHVYFIKIVVLIRSNLLHIFICCFICSRFCKYYLVDSYSSVQ